jgi:hypothetical protein
LLGKPDMEENSFDDELGVGVTFYFKLTSFLSIMFAIFTVISIPVYVLLFKASYYSSSDMPSNSLSALTLGIVGEKGEACTILPSINDILKPEFKYKNAESKLVCKYGKI